MYIQTLQIENFRGIRSLSLTNLSDLVVIAGPNGCGKSCIFDALRLLKSTYGGYQPNEWQQWFGEYQIDLNRDAKSIADILHDHSKPMSIRASFAISQDEKAYVARDLDALVEDLAWQVVVPFSRQYGLREIIAPLELESKRPLMEQEKRRLFPICNQLLSAKELVAHLTLSTRGQLQLAAENQALQLLFSAYRPGDLGIIDYHGPSRNYAREQVGGVNLNLDSDQNARQHALYNTANKYSNVKAEMASELIRDMFARQAGGHPAQTTLVSTLQRLFERFFPGKEFVGPMPDTTGRLTFPVRLKDGSTHDINDLSSGEKEILFGYLRIRKSAPRNSVLLIDEPELHLNPALIRGLPGFYHQYLGREVNNQIWMITHSDALIRDAISIPEANVFHMTPAIESDDGQIRRLQTSSDAESLIIDLVGDLSTYRPFARIVLIEGESAEVDIGIIENLFPEFSAKANMISSGPKDKVRRLRELLASASARAGLSTSIFSITDRDWQTEKTGIGEYQWDRYHIENYLLDFPAIEAAVRDLGLSLPDSVPSMLSAAARSTLDRLVKHQLQVHVYDRIRKELDKISIAPNSAMSESLAIAVAKFSQTTHELSANELASTELAALETTWRARYESALDDGTWIVEFRGRDVLRVFAGTLGIRYEQLRSLVVSTMRRTGSRPSGMAAVLDAVLAAK